MGALGGGEEKTVRGDRKVSCPSWLLVNSLLYNSAGLEANNAESFPEGGLVANNAQSFLEGGASGRKRES